MRSVRAMVRELGVLCTAVSVLATGAPAAAVEAFECVIEPAMTIKLGSQLTGVLRSVEADRGDIVKAGMIVARLDATLDERNLAIAAQKAGNETELHIAEVNKVLDSGRLVRRSELHKKQIVTQEVYDKTATDARLRALEVDRAKLALDLARLELERARALVELRNIRSPIDGVVIARRMAPGEMVSDERHILEIVKLDPLHVNAFVPISWYHRVRIGMIGTVVPDPAIGGSHRAKVTVKDPVSDAASSTFAVRLELPNPRLDIAAGVQCRVQLGAGG